MLRLAGELLAQFLVESLVIATIAMIVAVGALEVLIPLFNNAANKVMTLDYMRSLPWLLLTTLIFAAAWLSPMPVKFHHLYLLFPLPQLAILTALAATRGAPSRWERDSA